MIAMSYRNSRESRHSDCARDAGHNFKRNSGLRESTSFFASPAKNKWVAAFEPANVFAFASPFDHEPLDLVLLDAVVSRFFPNADDLGLRFGFFEQVQINQTIVEHNVGFAQACEPADGDQVRISRSRANDINRSDVFHDSMISFKRRSAPASSLRLSRSMISEFRIL